MDVLNRLISKAAEARLLQPLLSRPFQHRLSLYADDVVFFLRPMTSDIHTMTCILRLFEEAPGLKTNMTKKSVSRIWCSTTEIEVIQEHLPWRIEHFLVKYLGLPLSIKKLTKPQLQPIIDHLTNLLPG
jgi:hypothetical protein